MSMFMFKFEDIKDSATINILIYVLCEAYIYLYLESLYMEMLDKYVHFHFLHTKNNLKWMHKFTILLVLYKY